MCQDCVLPTLWREGGVVSQGVRGSGPAVRLLEFSSWHCLALVLGLTFPVCNLPSGQRELMQGHVLGTVSATL